MEKLTYSQILERLKNSGMSIDEFAYDDMPSLRIAGDYSEKAQEAQRVKDQWLKDNPNPGQQHEDLFKVWRDGYLSTPSNYEVAAQEWLEQNALSSWEEIDQEGGEDEGSHWHSVKYFKDHDVYIKVTGWYSSYNGTDFNGWDDACSEVRPQQKTITVYES